ncbi:MAG: zinc transport system permease protein [Parcubacteria group bacterium Licking1014_17]|nr:MAG: zinc transport system permease protein [Parcubacteria group bacterium Licking1014_17]
MIMGIIFDLNLINLLTALAVGLAAGYLGAFMVMRRMALVGDALSHVALPGVAIAYLYNFNPFLGAFAALFAGVIIIWAIEHYTSLSTESLVGLIFTFALAIGLIITPQEQILDALMGDISRLTTANGIFAIVASLAVILVMKTMSKKFIISSISGELATTSGISTRAIQFVFMILVAVVVALGIKVVGTLLMGALVVIPAIAAKNVSKKMSSYTGLSALFGTVSMVSGMILADATGFLPGPLIVLVSALIFAITFIFVEY